MKKVAIATLLSAAVLAAALAPTAEAGTFRGYVGLFGEPTHKANQGAGWTTNFRERKSGRVKYKVCLRKLSRPRAKRCYSRKTNRKGKSEIFVALFVNDEGGPGRWIARFRTDGRQVDRWKFRVKPE